MPSLLFEADDNLQVSVLDIASGTIKISMYNNLPDVEHVHLEICLDYDEIKMLSEWVSNAEYKLRDLQKNKETNG